MYELGIKQYKSSACHPESQGALKRFHQILKNMRGQWSGIDTIKHHTCFRILLWHRKILGWRHTLAFICCKGICTRVPWFQPIWTGIWAYCEWTLETSVRKFLLDDASSLNLLQYVTDFKNRLSKACEAARQSNLKSAQSKMKLHYYDRNFVDIICFYWFSY